MAEQSSNEVKVTPDANPATTIPDNKGDVPPAETKPEEKADEGYELELAEGSPLSEEDLNEIAQEAGRLSLSKEDAQKLIDAREKSYKNGLTKAQADQQAKIDAARKQIMADPIFQGEQAKKTFESMSRAIETFGDEEMVNLVKSPEFGNNVALARFLKKLGDALAPASDGENELKGGNGSAGAPQQTDGNESLRNLYPDFFKDKK